jgi:superfamily I DNA/RNA helicase
MSNFLPSADQQRIFNFIQNGRGSAVVIAVAGSGKTTTIVHAARLLDPRRSATFVAFNKTIAAELQQRLPKHVQAKTLNGMGFSAWVRGRNGLRVDANKLKSIVEEMVPELEWNLYRATLPKLIALAKSVGIVPQEVVVQKGAISLTPDTDAAWLDIISHHDIQLEDGADYRRLLDYARKVLIRSIEVADTFIDFDDQLYMPVIMRSSFWQNDFLFVDEAQDVNMIQRAMLKRALRPGGRLIAVGDPAQAIYGFRGADSDAIENIKREFGAVELPLSVSYRCAQEVVRAAQQYAPHIQASPTAPLGRVDHMEEEPWKASLLKPTDGLVCRNSAPLVKLAFRLLRDRMPCRVLGRDIGNGLVSLIKKMKAKNVSALEEKLSNYFERELAKYLAKGEEQLAAALEDKITTIKVVIEELGEGAGERTIPNLIKRIEDLFSDDTKGILTLCTIHKAKGLEWDRVFILDWFLQPSKYARQEWQIRQEANLQYVAITRAKTEIYFVNSDLYLSSADRRM